MNKPNQIANARRHQRTRRRLLAALAVILPVFVGGGWLIASALPGGNAALGTPIKIPEGIGFDQKLNARIPSDVLLTDSLGVTRKLSSVFHGQPILLNLVYFECPMLCNMSMDGLVRTLNTMRLRVGRDFQVVTISFDPREGPRLAAGAKRTMVARYGSPESAPGWHFFTADQASIDKVTKAVGFGYQYDEQSGQYAHAAGVVVLTPEGHISRYVGGVDYAARDLRLSLVEASAGRIGSVTDQALLLCYRYDPLTGKYGLAIARAIQFAAFVTVFAMVGGIGLALWRERQPGITRPGWFEVSETQD